MNSFVQHLSDASVNKQTGAVSAGATKPRPPTVLSTASMAAGGSGPWSPKTDATDNLTSIGAIGPGNPDYASVYPNLQIANPAGLRRHSEAERLPSNIVTGDFDRDARTDVAVWGITHQPEYQPCEGIEFRTVLARSPGGEQLVSGDSGVRFDHAASEPSDVTSFAADVHGDGDDDIVLTSKTRGLTVAKAVGDATFSLTGEWTLTDFGGKPDCSVADVDADGRSDLVCIYWTPNNARLIRDRAVALSHGQSGRRHASQWRRHTRTGADEARMKADMTRRRP